MTTKTFDEQSQERFASVSGDWNPLHMDPMSSRRTQFGRPLVHGVHLLLWAMDQVLDVPSRASIATISCVFCGHVGVGDPVECRWEGLDNSEQRIRVTSRSGDCLIAKIVITDPRPDLEIGEGNSERGACVDREIESIHDLSGAVALTVSEQALSDLFPRLTRCLPTDQLAFILSTTRIVGMECPGLHSIYSELMVEMQDPGESAARDVQWRVSDFDTRFNCVTIEAKAPGAQAVMLAFLRPQPQKQPSVEDVRRHVGNAVFLGMRAVVIGGSRGLGELCTKILATGGADVRFSYLRGREDAENVEREIRVAGGTAAAFAYDVLAPPDDLEERLGVAWTPTHLFYFPTPPITGGKTFSHDLFNTYCRYYVDGFHATWTRVRQSYGRPLSVFYPSSVYVEQINPSFGEYTAAKAAGEALCNFISATDKKSKIHVSRLPKLPTDQTLSVFGGEAEQDPVEVLAGALKAFGE